ncbi:SpaH/EbpB family LPXTG-anchored major pilin [Streptococcus pyogenes]
MRLSKKLLYSAMAFTMLTSAIVVPVAQIIPSSTVRAEAIATIPEKTTVKIYKLQADNYTDEVLKNDGLRNENGSEVEIGKLGTNVRGLGGVVFTAFKLTDGKTKEELKNLSIDELQKNYPNSKILNATANDTGLTTWELTKADNGRYWVVESTKPETVSNSVAVPFEISFPMSKSDGTGYLTEVNIYPKNVTSETPKSGKDVEKLGTNHASFNIGQEVSWFIKGTVPKNMKDYESYIFSDTLDSKLDFMSISYVKYGTLTLQDTVDYEATLPQADNRLFKVELTSTGIQKIANQYPNRTIVSDDEILDIQENTEQKPFLEVKFNTKINKTAVLGKAIPNSATIQFDNTPDKKINPKPSTPPSDNPDVQTGGIKFRKVDVTNKQALDGAEFELLTENEQKIIWTQELVDSNKVAIDAGKFVSPQVGQTIVMKSVNGEFEIRGLSYKIDNPTATAATAVSSTVGTKYKLKETKAPAGYVIPEAPIEFAVNQTSYNKTPTTIDVDKADADPQEITNNKRPSIPNTGGIGTAIFVVVGVIIMFVAARGMRRQKEDN